MPRRRPIAERVRWAALAVALTLAGALFALSSGAQAVTVNDQGASFVLPSAVGPGDTVVFDGSATQLMSFVRSTRYAWSFGDGTSANGARAVHTYAKRGNYTVKLTVTGPGGNATTYAQQIRVLRFKGLPVPPSNPPRARLMQRGLTARLANAASVGALQVRMQLMPQSLGGLLRSGIAVQIGSTAAANGIITVLVSRDTAKQLHIKGQGPVAVIGRGTLSSLTEGSTTLHLRLRLSQAMTTNLKSVKHLTLTVRLALVGTAGSHLVIDAAGRY
jgi:PKD domain